MMTPATSNYRDATDWGSDTGSPPSPITMADVKRARKVIKPFLTPTPMVSNPVLNERVGAEIFVKLENIQEIGAFKIRGAINLLATMDEKEREKGIVTATRGNYGAALTQACAMYDTKCTVR